MFNALHLHSTYTPLYYLSFKEKGKERKGKERKSKNSCTPGFFN